MADRFKDPSDPNTIKRSMHPDQAKREATRMASETLEAAGLGKLTEDNIRPKQPHSQPVGDYFFKSKPKTPAQAPRIRFPVKPSRLIAASPKIPDDHDHNAPRPSTSQTYANRYNPAYPLTENPPPAGGADMASSSSGSMATGVSALIGAVAGIATSVVTGGTLLPALLITGGAIGIAVTVQYLTKTGHFKEAQPMLAQAQMPARQIAPGEEMRRMIDSETARLQAERAQMTSAGSMEIEVPRTPQRQDTEKHVAILPKKDGPAR